MTEHQYSSLPGDYVAGLVDGEGCFYLVFRSEVNRNRLGNPKYYRWIPYFAIDLRVDDYKILDQIKDTLDCGKVYVTNSVVKGNSKKHAHYNVQDLDSLHKKVMPFFEKHQLRAKKLQDFKLWCQALEILYRHKGKILTKEQHEVLSQIRSQMRLYKSEMTRPYKNRPT